MKKHHISKRKHYTVVLVPNEDSGKSKSFRISLRSLVIFLIFFAFFLFGFVILVLTYTPVGELFPLSNKGLEQKYNRELVNLNKRMMYVMNELLELKARNYKLRKALGEKVTSLDSASMLDIGVFADSKNGDNFSEPKGWDSTRPAGDLTVRQQGEQTVYKRASITARYIPVAFPAILPVEGYITRSFEPEMNHFGIDIAGKLGTLVFATADGNVIFSDWTHDGGYVIIISHSGGFLSFYKHNQSLLKTAGMFVRRGEPIATLGNSGRTSLGPHLHFEIWKDGVPVDPNAYILKVNS